MITESGNFWLTAAIDCLRAASDGTIAVECRQTNLNFNLAHTNLGLLIKLFRHHAFSSTGSLDLPLGNPVSETLPYAVLSVWSL